MVYDDVNIRPIQKRAGELGIAIKESLHPNMHYTKSYDLYHDDGHGNGNLIATVSCEDWRDVYTIAHNLASFFYGS